MDSLNDFTAETSWPSFNKFHKTLFVNHELSTQTAWQRCLNFGIELYCWQIVILWLSNLAQRWANHDVSLINYFKVSKIMSHLAQ